MYNRLGTVVEFGESPTQGTEQGEDATTVSSQRRTLTELMRDMQMNQAALQRQVVDLSTARESGGVENVDALDNVDPHGRRSAGVRRPRQGTRTVGALEQQRNPADIAAVYDEERDSVPAS